MAGQMHRSPPSQRTYVDQLLPCALPLNWVDLMFAVRVPEVDIVKGSIEFFTFATPVEGFRPCNFFVCFVLSGLSTLFSLQWHSTRLLRLLSNIAFDRSFCGRKERKKTASLHHLFFHLSSLNILPILISRKAVFSPITEHKRCCLCTTLKSCRGNFALSASSCGHIAQSVATFGMFIRATFGIEIGIFGTRPWCLKLFVLYIYFAILTHFHWWIPLARQMILMTSWRDVMISAAVLV